MQPHGSAETCRAWTSTGSWMCQRQRIGVDRLNAPTSRAGTHSLQHYGCDMTLIRSIHHHSVLVRDTARALDFYIGVLGLSVDPARPDLGYSGAWLNVGAQQIHLLELPNPDADANRPKHVGRDRHVALVVDDLDLLLDALTRAGVDHSRSRSGRRAAFCRDPDGNGLEFVEQAS